MTPPVRIGIIGCGSVVSKYMQLAEQLQFRGQAQGVAACDIVPSRSQHMHDRYGVPRVTTQAQDIIEADDIDLVLVLTSMQEHYQFTRAALLAGKHVLVEKPMATRLHEAAELVEISKTSPGLL